MKQQPNQQNNNNSDGNSDVNNVKTTTTTTTKTITVLVVTSCHSPTFHSGQGPLLQSASVIGLLFESHCALKPPIQSTERVFFPSPHDFEH